MLTPEERDFIFQHAYLPEHLPEYVQSISLAEPFLHESHLCFIRQRHLIFVGYPLGKSPQNTRRAYDSACRRFRPSLAAITAPKLWMAAEEVQQYIEDSYYRLDLPLGPVRADHAYMIRRAGREVHIKEGTFGPEHKMLITNFLASRELSPEYADIFSHIGEYLAGCGSSHLIEARRKAELAAFNIVDFGSQQYAFYLFNFRSQEFNVPGVSDLLFYRMVEMAKLSGKGFMNLGLGISPGVRHFKEKWGAIPFLPYTSALVRRKQFDFWRLLESLHNVPRNMP